MQNYQSKPIPITAYVELARKARMLEEDWVQRALLALDFSKDTRLAKAFEARLRLPLLAEELDPYPFDIPSDGDFE